MLYVADQTGIEVESGSRGTGERGGEAGVTMENDLFALEPEGLCENGSGIPWDTQLHRSSNIRHFGGKMGIAVEGIFNVPFSAHLFQFLHYMQALKINHFCLNSKSAAVVLRDPTTALSVQKKSFILF